MAAGTAQAARATLVMVRHGETEGESSTRYHGRTDVALSELGREQMLAVARRFGRDRFAQVFASPLGRARESAAIIAGHDRIVLIDEFREVDFGLFEGLTADEIRARHPEDYKRWMRERLATDYAYPGGESRAAFTVRVSRGVERMFAHWGPGERGDCAQALLVAHRGVIRAIARGLAAVEPAVELGSIQVLELRERWVARDVDVMEHLRGK
jgi:broad specificity phosphatase PhoE